MNSKVKKVKDTLELLFTPIFLGSVVFAIGGLWYIAVPLVMFDAYLTLTGAYDDQ